MGAVAYSVLIPAVELARLLLRSPGNARAVVGIAATVVYLPLYVRHVRKAAQGIRPARAGWTLAAMAVVIVGVLPFLGAFWLGQFHALAVAVLLVLRPPWSIAVFAGIVVAQTPLAIALGHPEMASFFTLAGALKGLPVFLLIWLVGATRRLATAREALADRAVAGERLRIDGDMRQTVGSALESIVAQGDRLAGLTGRDLPAAEHGLRNLVQDSRRALANARRLIRGYQQPSLAAELDTAATLLSAAGIASRVVLPDGALPDDVPEPARTALRADILRLLGDDTVRECVIRVGRHNGQLRLTAEAVGTA